MRAAGAWLAFCGAVVTLAFPGSALAIPPMLASIGHQDRHVTAMFSAPRSDFAVIPPYRLSSLSAYLFFNDSGTFSRNIPANAALWNTIIGEAGLGDHRTPRLSA
jgi:hypothetical protein